MIADIFPQPRGEVSTDHGGPPRGGVAIMELGCAANLVKQAREDGDPPPPGALARGRVIMNNLSI